MYKHILIPTDGSPASAKAIKAGIALAKQVRARVTGYHGLGAVPYGAYGEPMHPELNMQAADERHRHLTADTPVDEGDGGIVPEPLLDEVLARIEEDDEERRAA